MRLTLCLLTALTLGACSPDLSGTQKPGAGIGTDDDGIMPGGTGGGSGGGTNGAVSGGTSGGVVPPPGPTPDASVDTDGAVGPTDGGQTPDDDLVGDYAQKRAFRTQQKVQSGALSSTIRVLTTTYAVVRITKENGKYRFYESPCRIASETTSEGALKVEISVKDAVPRALGEIASAFTVTESSGKQTFDRPLTSAPLGWEPASAGDKIPTNQNDARLRDSDGDGKPGVTATVRTSGVGVIGDGKYDAYFVQWNRTRYQGTVQSDGKLVGQNFDTTEQSVVGTSTMLPNTGGSNSQPMPDANTADNAITLVPLAQALDCDELVDQIDSIF